MWKHPVIPNNKWMALRIANSESIRFVHPTSGEMHEGKVRSSWMTRRWGWSYNVYDHAVTIRGSHVVAVTLGRYYGDRGVARANLDSTLRYAPYPIGTMVEYVLPSDTSYTAGGQRADTYIRGIVVGNKHRYDDRETSVYNGEDIVHTRGWIRGIYNIKYVEGSVLGPIRSSPRWGW